MTSQTSDLAALDRLTASRSTCRAYQPRALDGELIRNIVDMASRSASWCNVQPWQLVITESPESTERFRQALAAHAASHPEMKSDLPFPPGYEGVHAQRRREAGYALYKALGITREDTARRDSQSFENFRLFGAPHVAIVTVPAQLGPYAAVDAGGFVASFLLSAHGHGVATTPQAALARHAHFVRGYFGIPDTQHMVCGISFGYAEANHPVNKYRTSRASVDELVRFV
ncbi:MAG: nitroreductase family protein [Burkholderiaceae bacterium]